MKKLHVIERILERIHSIDEWPSENHGEDRLQLIQTAFDMGLL